MHCNPQVVYLRPAVMVKSPGQPPLADRLALQSASNEATRLLCALASAAAGYHVEEVVQVGARHLSLSLG